MKISALILTKNEEEMIKDCLKQLDFVNEIIVLDQNSTDQTVKIAKKYTPHVASSNIESFDKNRNTLAAMAKGEWLFYLDADERLDQAVVTEIKEAVKSNQYSAYYFPRKNLILGKWLKHGGWWPDYVPRLFKKKMLLDWHGVVHESPEIKGEFGYLKSPIEHLTARFMSSMLLKTIKWARTEAELFKEANHPKVTVFTVIKSLTLEFTRRYILKLGFADGVVGLIESVFQALHRAIVLTYLWEFQNNTQSKFKKIKSE